MPLLLSRMVQSLLLLGIGTINPFLKYLGIYSIPVMLLISQVIAAVAMRPQYFRCSAVILSHPGTLRLFNFMIILCMILKSKLSYPISSWSIFKRFENSFASTSHLKSSSNSTLCLSQTNLDSIIPFPMNIIGICTKFSGVI